MKRHASLHPLSQHHHFALIQALQMRRAAEAPAEKRDAAIARQVDKFIVFWHKTGETHFREEEEVLLPACTGIIQIELNPLIKRLLAEHAEIREAVRDFERLRAGKQPIGNDAVARLAALLHDHVRFEENELFPRIERALGEENLHAVGRGLTRLHSKTDVCDV